MHECPVSQIVRSANHNALKWADTSLCYSTNLNDLAIMFSVQTGYAAVSSYHIATEASLVALNKELQSPVSMDRFRPNIVIGGTEPFDEVKCHLCSIYC